MPGVSEPTGKAAAMAVLTAVSFVLAGCEGGQDAPPEAIRITYEYRLDDDRDSVSTALDAGRYEVRVDGDCDEHELVLTKGGAFDGEEPVNDLVAEGFDVDGGRWRIRQRSGDEMRDCQAVVLYPGGVAAPPVPRTTPTTTTPTAPPARQSDVVADWADEHLEEVADVHGSLVGLVDAAREIRDLYGADEAVALCGEFAAGPIGFVDEADEALDTYPGDSDLPGKLDLLATETVALFGRCAQDVSTLGSIDAWSLADADVALTVLEIVEEAGGTVGPTNPMVVSYEEGREDARLAKVSEIKTIALRNRPGG